MTKEIEKKFNDYFENAFDVDSIGNAYELYGMFCIHFEQMIEDIREYLIAILFAHGLMDRVIAKIQFADLTAYPIKERFLTTCIEIMESDNDKKIIKKLAAKIDDAISKRNEFVHGTWNMENNCLTGYKHKLTKQGLDDNNMEIDCTSLKEIIYNLNKISFCLDYIPTHSRNLSKTSDVVFQEVTNTIKGVNLEFVNKITFKLP